MNISTSFAPPFKLIAPYFIIGSIALCVCMVLLFGVDIQSLHLLSSQTLGWVHLFLLGFVMMVIFGAMAQLVPVVLEVGHFAVELYYVIYPLLIIGALMMACGFLWYPLLLSFGGVIAFIAFGIFLIETFLTILKVKKINFVIFAVVVANISLLCGLIVGIWMALGYGGLVDVDIFSLLPSHIYLVFIGYVCITIMGMSLVLLPMFWLSHNFSWIYVKSALGVLILCMILILFGTITTKQWVQNLALLLTLIAFGLYCLQVFIIFKKRVRVEKDIYLKTVLFAYICFFISLLLGVVYLFYPSYELLLIISWFGVFCFVTFLILGHLYKIVPFLVWYERFSLHVGKKKVPMLADMVPKQSANLQLFFNGIGVFIVPFGLYFQNNSLFKGGVSLLVVGFFIFLKDIFFMINFKESKSV